MRRLDARGVVQLGLTGMLLAWLLLFSAGCATTQAVPPILAADARPVTVVLQHSVTNQWALFAYTEAGGGLRVVQLTGWMATPEAVMAAWHR